MIRDLKDLLEQYQECIKIQERIIACCRRDYNEAVAQGKRKRSVDLARNLRILYDEKNDLIASANEIKKYLS